MGVQRFCERLDEALGRRRPQRIELDRAEPLEDGQHPSRPDLTGRPRASNQSRSNDVLLAVAHAEADDCATRRTLVVHPYEERHTAGRAREQKPDPGRHGPAVEPEIGELAASTRDERHDPTGGNERALAEHEPVRPGATGELHGHPVSAPDIHEQLVPADVLGVRQDDAGMLDGQRSDDQVPRAGEFVTASPARGG